MITERDKRLASIRLISLETHYAVQQHDVEWLLDEIERLDGELAMARKHAWEFSKPAQPDREAFEAWIRASPYKERALRRPDDATNSVWCGQYQNPAVQIAWEAWQEAKKPLEMEQARCLSLKNALQASEATLATTLGVRNQMQAQIASLEASLRTFKELAGPKTIG